MIDINQQMNQIKEMISGLIPGLSDGLRGSIKNIDKSKLPKEFQNIDFDLWEETVELQNTFNEKTVPGWKEKKLDWWMAIIDEWNEILNSYRWKWWKDTNKLGQVDFKNIEVEMVDIFHFLISKAIEENKTDFFYSIIFAMSATKSDQYIQNPQLLMKKIRKEALPMSGYEVFEIVAIIWSDIWFKTGKTYEDLMKWYRVKNALNIIRQEYGYKEGNYIKQWGDMEDNEVAWKIADELELNKDMFNDLLNELRKYYEINILSDF